MGLQQEGFTYFCFSTYIVNTVSSSFSRASSPRGITLLLGVPMAPSLISSHTMARSGEHSIGEHDTCSAKGVFNNRARIKYSYADNMVLHTVELYDREVHIFIYDGDWIQDAILVSSPPSTRSDEYLSKRHDTCSIKDATNESREFNTPLWISYSFWRLSCSS